MTSGAPLRLVVFDMDGTLIDSQKHIVASMEHAFRANGLPDPDPAAVRSLVGLPLHVAIPRLAPGLDDDRARRVEMAYRENHKIALDRGQRDEPAMPGAVEAVRRLDSAGYLLAVATGKGNRGANYALTTLGIRDLFVSVQTSDTAPGKPDPTMLRQALAEAGGVEPHRAVMVGDTTFDLEMARNAGVPGIAVSWGYHSREILSEFRPAALIHHFDDLYERVEALIANK